MVSKFAFLAGVSHSKAWARFRNDFNHSYNTNVGLLITNYKAANEITKKVTVPEFLETTDRLDDAIRVADKMIQEVEKDAIVAV